MAAAELTSRDQEILSAVVRAHITSGAPVPSSVVARRHGRISPATVRTVMARLERCGYLRQPHTSAGRVPTLRAFARFARQMAGQARLRSGDRDRIDGLMTGRAEGVEELLDRAPHVLAEVCKGVGLLVLSPLSQSVLTGIRFVPLSERRVLIVAETRSGLVRDKVVRTGETYARGELEKMSAYLNEHFRGWTLAAIRKEMERRVRAERSRFLQQALELCRMGFVSSTEPEALHFEGLGRLLEQTDTADPEAVRKVLTALEEKRRLAEFLGECVEEPDTPLGIQVGLARLSPAMKEYTLIGASYGGEEQPLGWLGFLGPARTDYARAITGVRYVAALIDRRLAEN